MPNAPMTLEELRAEIDGIDDQIHDLLMRRTELVEAVGQAKGRNAVMRPAREAKMLRRLIERHKGKFPKRVLINIWRELFSGFSAVQGRNAVAVYMPETESGYWELARAHFGSFIQMQPYPSVGQVMRAVSDGLATIGVLPLPEEDDHDPWWRNIVGGDTDPLRINGCLPFTGVDSRTSQIEAVTVAKAPLEPSDNDCSFIALEFDRTVSRAKLLDTLNAVDIHPSFMSFYNSARQQDRGLMLIEVDGFWHDEEEALSELTLRYSALFFWTRVIGCYPRPFELRHLR